MSRIAPSQVGLHIALVSFGLAVGVGALALVWPLLHKKMPAGSEFESLGDLRAAMLSPERQPAPEAGKAGATLNDIIDPHPNDRLIYLLRANLTTQFQGVPVTINAARMRDKPVDIERPANTYRIAFLGDSFTFGWGVEEQEAFPAVLENSLNRMAAGKRNFEVLNFGVPGYSTFQEVALYEEIGADYRPDAVIVFFIENDFGLPFFIRNPDESGGFLSAFQFSRLISKGGSEEIHQQRREIEGANANRALKNLALKTAAAGTKLYLVFNPKKNWKELMRQLWVLREKDLNIKVLNIRRELLRYTKFHEIPDAALSLPTDPHPSPLKHRLIGELLAPYFMEALP